MTRKEKMDALEAKYVPKFKVHTDKIDIASTNLNDDRAARQIRLDAINSYYDALDAKVKVDAIVNLGEPII